MRILYPYNEILPKKMAHDVYIFQECAALANLGWDITLLCGLDMQKEHLFWHYQTPMSPHFHLKKSPILRKNNWFNLSWNFPFFFNTQRVIKKFRPDYVFLSVRKQGAYHLKRKIPGVRYLYEVHELSAYPNQKPHQDFQVEKELLSQADLITVTTNTLKKILTSPPYELKKQIEVVPLAVASAPLPPPSSNNPLTLLYVGQLYDGQGIPLLLNALHRTSDVHLKIVGGQKEEIASLSKMTESLGISKQVEFVGFVPPAQLPSIAEQAHAFVAPFENRDRMPYVAHTKLLEYASWGRPFIAPDLPIVREHFDPDKGVLLFDPGNIDSLASCIKSLKDDQLLTQLQTAISIFRDAFSWEERAKRYATLLSTHSNSKTGCL